MLLNISVFISPTPFLDSMDKKKNIVVLIFLIVILFAVNYSYLDSALEAFFYGSEIVFVDRVIDGDTFVVNSSSVRLLGINCPEKGERLYSEAGDFLSDFVLNESARLVRGNEDTDRYARLLRYVFVDDVNVNLELVRNGYANFYFPGGKDFYYNDFVSAWNECLKKNINLCEKSVDVCSDCIKLDYLDADKQEFSLVNDCLYDCDISKWSVKDEGRKKFVFPDFILKKEKNVIVGIDSGDFLWGGNDYVWTETGDSLFLRDEEGKLVLFYSY
jgi:hypothetical protein